MKNAAGDFNCSTYIPVELALAGINVIRELEVDTKRSEVPQFFTGELHGWKFVRAWYYWMCNGPALPFKYATPMHDLIGQEVRVCGHCGCPAPEEYLKKNPGWQSGGVELYHIDTQEGLNIFANVIKKWYRDAHKEELKTNPA